MSILFLTGLWAAQVDRILALHLDFSEEQDKFARATFAKRTSHSATVQRNASTDWVFAEAEKLFRFANEAYGFALSRIEDSALVVRYDEGSQLDWHTDTSERPGTGSVRKISLTVQLSHPSAYSGGDLQFATYPSDPFSREIGTAVLFPSYAAHRVTPLLSGTRYAFVAFAEGPPFV